MFLLFVQIGLPVMLLGWLAAYPAAGLAAYALHAAATVSIILALGLVGLWVMPPWWTPYLYGLTFAAVIAWQVATRRIDAMSLWSPGRTATACLLLLAGVGALERFRPWRGQSLAVDIIRITRLGLRADGWRPVEPARYATFGTPLLAPCSGTVAIAVDGVPDMPVPVMDRQHMAGNFVMIDCGEFAVALAHMRRGSVAVENGDQVQLGDPIGEMGNSGNSSEPHLHLHAQRGIPDDAPFGGEPLGLTVDGRFLVRNERITAGKR